MDPKHPKMATSRGGHTAKTFCSHSNIKNIKNISTKFGVKRPSHFREIEEHKKSNETQKWAKNTLKRLP